MKVDEIVERLREALGLRGSLRPRLRAAYQELETGQLDPAGVNERVWEALHAILGLDPCRLVRYEPPVAAPAFFRAAEFEAGRAGAVASAHREAEPDEVDRLFRARLP